MMDTEADKLHRVLENTCNLKLDPREFRRSFDRAFDRTLTADPEEFAALVFAEIWSSRNKTQPMDGGGVLRAIERVKSRLRREVLKHRGIASFSEHPELAAKEVDAVPEIVSRNERLELIEGAILPFLKTLTAKEALIFEECVIGQTKVDDFTARTHMPRASVYRYKNSLRARFKAFIDNLK